jgi:hypothetical protein
VHALRALRRDEQVEPELPAFGGEANDVLGRECRHLVGRLAWADVMRLVDHDQDRLALGPPPPQCCEHALSRERLLAGCLQRSEVDDEPAGPARRNEILQ